MKEINKDSPMIPYYEYDFYTIEMTGLQWRTCPVCGTEVFKGDDKCEKCGQALDWEEE